MLCWLSVARWFKKNRIALGKSSTKVLWSCGRFPAWDILFVFFSGYRVCSLFCYLNLNLNLNNSKVFRQFIGNLFLSLRGTGFLLSVNRNRNRKLISTRMCLLYGSLSSKGTVAAFRWSLQKVMSVTSLWASAYFIIGSIPHSTIVP